MKRVALAIVSTVAALVMLLSFKSHATTAVATAPPAAVSSTGSASTSSDSGTGSTTTTKKRRSTTPKPTATAVAKTYTGSAINTQYGPVQVQITVKNGKITAANAIEYPENDPRDQQINSYAVPALNSEVVQANSASIDTISGASYTSTGYISSLQSAIDQAAL